VPTRKYVYLSYSEIRQAPNQLSHQWPYSDAAVFH